MLRDYTIQAVLGHGGFGIVYKASHNELDQIVAIKEYLPSELAVREGATVRAKSADRETYFADGLRRFREEANALIDFQRHPSTVACSEFFRANGTAYLVMEYVDGQPLSQVLWEREATGQPFTESDLLAVAVPLAEGLAHIHRAGVIHRDIKPANILVRRADRQPVLIDFGAAKQAVAEHSRSLAPYTEGYAALEQVADGRLGPWTDLYGYGAVLWRMVAGGNRPWEPPNPAKVEQRSHAVVSGIEDPMPLASELGEGRFPSNLLEVIDGCLRLWETERIQGSRELLEALCEPSEPPPAEAVRPLAERSGAQRQERGSGEMRAVSVPRGSGGIVGAYSSKPWIRDWDALGDIRGPGFAMAARAYIERYKRVLAARVWVAKAEGLAELSEWRAANPTRREAGESWVNALGMEFVWIPAGNFLMGSTLDQLQSSHYEREVRISEGFWIGKYEVTQGEWEAVMGTNPSEFSKCGPRCPVENVSWHDAGIHTEIERTRIREQVCVPIAAVHTEVEREWTCVPIADGCGVGVRGTGRYDRNALRAVGRNRVVLGQQRREDASSRPKAGERVGLARHAGKRDGVGGWGLAQALHGGSTGRCLGPPREVGWVGASRPATFRLPLRQPRLPLGHGWVTLRPIAISPSCLDCPANEGPGSPAASGVSESGS